MPIVVVMKSVLAVQSFTLMLVAAACHLDFVLAAAGVGVERGESEQ